MATEPRDGSISLGGIPWLARMTDKARLEAAGEIEQFDLEYPCPMDRSLLSQLGLEAKDFQNIATTSTSDEELLSRLSEKGIPVKA